MDRILADTYLLGYNHSVMENPLVQYKKKLSVSWSFIAKGTGISLVQIQRISTWDAAKMRNMTLDTVIKLRSMGIDCVEFAQKG